MVMEIPENCVDVQNALHLYVGADLEAEVQAAVSLHLDGCTSCRSQAVGAQASRTAFLELADDAPISSVWSDVRAQLIREGVLQGPVSARRSQWWIIPAAAAASVAAVMLTLNLQGGRNLQGDSNQAPSAPIANHTPQPVVLQPVEPGAKPLVDPRVPFASPFQYSTPGASAAGNESRTVIVPSDPYEIIR